MMVSTFEENIFGLPVFRLRIQELASLSEMLCDYAREEFKRDREGMVYGPDTAWHSRSSLHEVEQLSFFLSCVDKAISIIWSKVGWDRASHPWQHNALWTNISRRTDFTAPHAHWGHAQSNFGGVYYSKASGDCGDLRFYTPDKHLSSIDGFAVNKLKPFERVTFFDLKVSTGDLVIFPNWLRHAALPNLSQGDRISWTFLSEVAGLGIAAPPLSGLPEPDWSLPDFGSADES